MRVCGGGMEDPVGEGRGIGVGVGVELRGRRGRGGGGREFLGWGVGGYEGGERIEVVWMGCEKGKFWEGGGGV